MLAKNPFRMWLRELQNERIARVLETRKIEPRGFSEALKVEVDRRARLADFNEAMRDTYLLEHLERARMEGKGPRAGVGSSVLLDEPAWHAPAQQLVGEHQAGGPGADD
jgi:hypothetical protein